MRLAPPVDLESSVEPMLIVCMRESEFGYPSQPGDMLRTCAGCLRAIRIAPTSQALLAQAERLGRRLSVRCIQCAEPLLGRPGMKFGSAPGADEEIKSRMGDK